MFLIRWTVFIIHIVLVLLLYATLLNAYVSPKFLSELNLLSLSFPLLCFINILCCIYWLVQFRKRGLFFLMTLVLLLTPIRRWVNFTPTNQEPLNASYEIISFNIKNGILGLHNIRNYIEDQNADIVILQESSAYKENHRKMPYVTKIDLLTFYSREPIVGQGRILIEADNGYAAYIDTSLNSRMVRVVNLYLKPFSLEKSMVKPSKDIEITENKARMLVKKLLPIFKTHQNQVDQIQRMIADSPYPVILGGDFNAVPNSYEYYTLSKGFKDSFLEAGSGLGTSFHDYKIPIRIDYLFFSNKDFEIRDFHTDRSRNISDHYPIIAKFDFLP